VGCPIRKSTDQSLFAAPHGLSQRITSFIACACQGIHQMPLYHLIILIANAHHFGVRSRRSPVWGSSALSADCRAIRRPSGLRTPHPEMVHVLVPGSSASGVSVAKREVSLMTYSHSRTKRELCSVRAPQTQGMCNPSCVLQRCSVPIPSGEGIGERPAS
jgi:hypothetical protein